MRTLVVLAFLTGLLPLAAAPARAEELVAFNDPAYRAGTIVVRTSERRLYYVLGRGQALRYTVGVGKSGKQWFGQTRIEAKYLAPAWSPPPEVKRDIPSLPDLIPGGAKNNPMGAAALVLTGGEYAIHGTNRPKSVGGFVSYGCFRMHNDEVTRLYARVRVGTRVIVTQ